MALELTRYLELIGISKKEIDVYLYLLSVDSAFPIRIAKETNMKRSTVYVILDLLKEKRLVREIQKGKRFCYEAEEIDRIRFFLEERKLKTEEYIKSLDTIIPQLKATRRKKGEAPIIRFFEGEASVQESMSELASNPRFRSEVNYDVFPLELVYDLFKHRHLREYIDLRIKKNKFFRIIYTAKEGNIQIDKEHDQEALKIEEKDFPISCDISIFEDEVRIHMLGDTIYGILIKNPELAETLTSLIKLALKNSKK